ncbi:hypothetical protein Thiosp_02191 [Thiorhodovibrio litoralis]|nr:hypothetical protein Thiosp_02191 [Thiorhodovibrio litoralis]
MIMIVFGVVSLYLFRADLVGREESDRVLCFGCLLATRQAINLSLMFLATPGKESKLFRVVRHHSCAPPIGSNPIRPHEQALETDYPVGFCLGT